MVFPRLIAEGPPEMAPLVPVAVELGEGTAVAVRVPPHDALPPVEQWPIDAAEREHARGFGPRRQNTWIAGRMALRAAGERLGVAWGPILPDARRAPALPSSVSGSLTHTSEWAVAWLAPADGRTRGVDLEDAARSVVKLAATILTAGAGGGFCAAGRGAERGDRAAVCA
jgi:4'-phosphopantetheinyl transferase EntD